MTVNKKYLTAAALLGLLLLPALGLADYQGDKGLSKECYEVLHSGKKLSEIDPKIKEKCLKEIELKVVVSASRKEEILEKVPSAVSVVNFSDIKDSMPLSVGDAVRDVPGVLLRDAGQPGFKRIRIRGERAKRVAILIDGQEFIDHRDVGTPLLIDPQLIERIEVVRGGGGVLYGSRSTAGIVNIITKKGGYHPFQASVNEWYDTATNGHNSSASIFGRKSGFEYRLFLGKTEHNNRHTPDGDLENTSFKNDTASFYLAKKVQSHKIAFMYDTFDGQSDVWVAPEVRFTPPFKDFAISAPQRDREKYSVFYNYEPRESSLLKKVKLDLYRQKSRRRFNTFSELEFSTGSAPLNIKSSTFTTSELKTIGGHLQTEIVPLEDHYLNIGVQWLNDDLDQERVKERIINLAPIPKEDIADSASQTTVASWIHDEWSFSKDWLLAFGARGYLVQSQLDSTTRSNLSPRSTVDRQVIAKVSLAYYGVKGHNFWGSVEQGYSYPSLTQLATGAFAGPDFVNPNLDLNPEKSWNFNLGWRSFNSHFRADAVFFLNLAKDYIDHVKCSVVNNAHCTEPVGRRDRVWVNIGRAKSYGIESSFSLKTKYNISPYISATVMRRKLTTLEFKTFESRVPVFWGRGGVKYRKTVHPLVDLWLNLYLDGATASKEKKSLTTSERSAGYATLNLAVGARVGVKRNWNLSVKAVNILDKKYSTASENILGEGRALVFGVSTQL